jgi:hypothetical protein
VIDVNKEEASQLAHEIIDMVEHDIRKAHSEIDQIAMDTVVEEDYKPNTLLYGDAYYQLEDAIVEKLIKKQCPC